MKQKNKEKRLSKRQKVYDAEIDKNSTLANCMTRPGSVKKK